MAAAQFPGETIDSVRDRVVQAIDNFLDIQNPRQTAMDFEEHDEIGG
jgi:hypothetical protein